MISKDEYFHTKSEWKNKILGKFERRVTINRSSNLSRDDTHNMDGEEDDDSTTHCRSGCAQDSITVLFLTETSIHGVKYIAQRERHWSERLFWLIAFLLGVVSSVYLIYGVWDRYNKTPVVVTFDVKEQTTNSIPFPAVTLCNVNLFSKQMVENLSRVLDESEFKSPEYLDANNKLEIVSGLCNAHKTYLKELKLAFNEDDYIGAVNISHDDVRLKDAEILDFLTEVPCDKLIRTCKFGGHWFNCSDLFKPLLTDYGKCCTFNILPLPLLLRNPNIAENITNSLYDNPMLGSRAREHWNESELDLWAKWNYDKEDIDVPLNSSRPYRQKRAGRRYGLSIGIDLNSGDLICPVADSEGLIFTLHSPLEMPHVKEYSSAIHMGKEMYVEVNADVTKADDDIQNFPQEKRECFFGVERRLNFYGPYTRGNCIDECAARVTVETCGCAAFHLPNFNMDSAQVNFCFNSSERACADEAQMDLEEEEEEDCPNCDPLCEEIKYNYQMTMANLKPVNRLVRRRDNNYTRTNANRSIALLHIFFGSERTVPKLRKSLYGIEDLIANTGGILGLCLGFSVLSGIELIYFFTLRTFWKHCKRQNNSLERKMISVARGGGPESVFMSRKIPAWDNPRAPTGNVTQTLGRLEEYS